MSCSKSSPRCSGSSSSWPRRSWHPGAHRVASRHGKSSRIEWAVPIFGEQRFASTYALTTRINPYFLQGDFNGDGKLDLAALIEHKRTAQQGIAILHAGTRNAIILGAGREIGNGGDDFSWQDAWSIRARGPVAAGADGKNPPTLRGDALLVQKLEAASALIYWDGAAYRWYQQGD